MILRGRIAANTPTVFGRVRNGRLLLGARGDVPFVIDTGFTGSVAVPDPLARRLIRQFVAVDTYLLAAGQEIELPMYVGSVQIAARRIRTCFIVGDALIGMEFLQQVCSDVRLNLDSNLVELTVRRAR